MPMSQLTMIVGHKAQSYIGFLAQCGIVQRTGDEVNLAPDVAGRVDNIGPTLECYVAEVCQMDLTAPAAWGAVAGWSRVWRLRCAGHF